MREWDHDVVRQHRQFGFVEEDRGFEERKKIRVAQRASRRHFTRELSEKR
jgi:hypothetical protein